MQLMLKDERDRETIIGSYNWNSERAIPKPGLD
jgi:hypothetical protein